jgi:rare lipoprotein A (peptidoglycan hydrolase)
MRVRFVGAVPGTVVNVGKAAAGVRPALAGALLLVGGLLGALPVSGSVAGEGLASYYGKGFHGRRTASGERFNQNAMTAAHRSLGFGTKVRVTHQRTGRSVVVTINDRGPFRGGRIIDLSRGAAQRLGMLAAGVAPVRVEVLGRDAARGHVRASQRGGEAALVRELF